MRDGVKQQVCTLYTCVASQLHPWVTLLEGHDEGGPVNHGLQFLPGLILEKGKTTRNVIDVK